MVGFGAGVTTYANAGATFNGDMIRNFNNANDQINVTGLNVNNASVTSQNISSTQEILNVFSLFGQFSSATTFTTAADHAGTGTSIKEQQHPMLVAHV